MNLQDALGIVNSQIQVNSPGQYDLRVTSVTDMEDYRIVNLNGATPYLRQQLMAQAVELGRDSDQFQPRSLSGRDRDFSISKGQMVQAYVDYVTLKDEDGNPTDEQALLVTSISAISSKKSRKSNVSLDDFLAQLDALEADATNSVIDNGADDGDTTTPPETPEPETTEEPAPTAETQA